MPDLKDAMAKLPSAVVAILKFNVLYNKFRYMRRVLYTKKDPEREPNGEHTDQIVLTSLFVRDKYLPHLNAEKVLRYAALHDLVEVHAGDTSAFPDKFNEFDGQIIDDRSTKELRERRALAKLRRTLGWPEAISTIEAYQMRIDEESRFVYALDKFVADLNIFEDDGRTNHMLGVTYEEKIAYKRPRIAEHGFVLECFDAFCAYCKEHPELYFRPNQTAAE